MKKRMDELIRETFVFDAPKLTSSVSEIRIELDRNGNSSGSLTLSSEDGSRFRGTAFSDNRRIAVSDEPFSGSSCVIRFTIESVGVERGKEICGTIIARTSIGEKRIPVTALVRERSGGNAGDEIRALEDFTRLAQNSPVKAFRFFISEDFTGILNGKNTPLRTLYKGLSQNPVTYQHMEEFLVSAGKKEPVHISIDKHPKNSYRVSASLKDTIYLYKSTWGYCHIDVEITGDFIETDKLEISSDDFIGKVYGLEFIINRDRLSTVPRYGNITLKTPYDTIVIGIEASLEGGMTLLSGTYRKQRIAGLVRKYLDLQLRRIDYRSWYEESMQLIEELKQEREDGVTLFGEAFLAYTNEDNNRAIELLWKARDGEYSMESVWERAAYQYLSKHLGILPEEKQDIVPKLRAYYQRHPECWLILALYQKEEEAPPYRAVWGLAEYEKAAEAGCSSPFLYLRAYKELEKQEGVLRSITPFILSVLSFAQRKGILSSELQKQAAFLSESDHGFRPPLYRLMKTAYEQNPDRELLETICKYISKDDPRRRSYYRWYEKAVEEGLPLAGLYENYIMTRPDDDPSILPERVRIYYRYNHTVPDSKLAVIYSLIVRHKEEDPDTYENYRQQMENFAVAKLTEGKMNEYLSVLYTEFILPRKDLELASALARVAFTHRLVCRDPAIRRVVICHPSLKDENIYELAGGEAYPNIYGPDARVLLEDSRKRRFATTIPYELTPLMNIDKTARSCADLGVWDTGLQLYCCHERGWQMDVNTRTVLSFLMAAENPGFTRSHRDRLRRKLLVYFTANPEDPYAHKFAEKIKEGTYGWVDKKLTFELLIRFGLHEKALKLTERLGWEGLEEDQLLIVADAAAYSGGYEPDAALTDLCAALFRKERYTDRTLRYLARNFDGGLNEMEKIWQQASRGDADCEKLEERILLTAMFTRILPENGGAILEDYARGGANAAVMRACLSFIGEYYLLENRPIGDAAAERFRVQCNLKDEHMQIIALSWLKYLSTAETIPEKEMPKIRKLMKNCSADGLRFTFLQKLAERIGDPIEITDRTIIEERFPCGTQAVIHYRMDDGDFRTEPMKERIRGLYTKEFLLFCGEQLEYYYTVRQGDKSFDTEKKRIRQELSDTEGPTRFHILNRLVYALQNGREAEAKEAAEDYLKQEACIEQFFDIM